MIYNDVTFSYHTRAWSQEHEMNTMSSFKR